MLPSPVLQFTALCIAAAAIFAGQPFFWVLPGRFLTGAAAAAGFAAINSVGNLGGFVARAVVPKLSDEPGSGLVQLVFLAAVLECSGSAVFLFVSRMPPGGRDVFPGYTPAG